jgi:tRNA (uracil-5-)-methyltransferase
MLSYEKQLNLKLRVVEKAYQNFSGDSFFLFLWNKLAQQSQLGLPSDLVPSVLATIPSPKTYGYRTKITPHFDAPPKNKKGEKPFELTIGFGEKGRRRVLDIEECVIATPVLNDALPIERQRIQR